MAAFSYRAMNPTGNVVRGRMDALNLVDLEMRLKRLGLDFINGEVVQQRGRVLGPSISRRELITFCFHLESLIASGVPLLDALTDLRDSVEQAQFRQVIAGVIESIEGGRTVSQALGEHPKVFDAVFCSLIRAGEESGNLPEVLAKLGDSLRWEDELTSYTKKLVMYPSFLVVVLVAVTFFLMIYLVPQMASFIRNMGQELPLHTRFLIATSRVFVDYWWLILTIPVVIALSIRTAITNSAPNRLRFDAFKLRLPLVGGILRKIILSRFASVFALLYASGISVLDALRTTEGVVGNAQIRDGLQRAGTLIAEGRNVTSAFQEVGLFPPLILRMLRVGEGTGGLDHALNNVSYFYNRDVKESIARAQAVAEPLLTVILGSILGWVMLAVLGPVYDVITKVRM